MGKRCASHPCQRDPVLLHNDTGYCVWHYRMLPDSILRKPHEAP